MPPRYQPIRPPKEMKLLAQLRSAIRTRHYSIRTERAYAGWVKHFILFHDKRHPEQMKDLKEGCGAVYLPKALGRKYPNAPRQWKWQYVFPSHKRSIDPRSGIERRHHVSPESLQKQ